MSFKPSELLVQQRHVFILRKRVLERASDFSGHQAVCHALVGGAEPSATRFTVQTEEAVATKAQ